MSILHILFYSVRVSVSLLIVLSRIVNFIEGSLHHLVWNRTSQYSETSVHCFRQGSEKETMDPGKQ
jgi:hypothetical protein